MDGDHKLSMLLACDRYSNVVTKVRFYLFASINRVIKSCFMNLIALPTYNIYNKRS